MPVVAVFLLLVEYDRIAEIFFRQRFGRKLILSVAAQASPVERMFLFYIFSRKIFYVAFLRYDIAEPRIFGVKYVYVPDVMIDKLRIDVQQRTLIARRDIVYSSYLILRHLLNYLLFAKNGNFKREKYADVILQTICIP